MPKPSFARRAFAHTSTYLSTLPEKLSRGVDGFASVVSPTWGTKRRKARSLARLSDRLEKILGDRMGRGSTKLGALEGAQNDRHRGHAWLGSRLSPDNALQDDLETIREHSNELALNNCWMANYVAGLVSYSVGSGRRPQAKIPEIAGRLSKEQAEQHNSELEDLFDRWACCCGANGETLFEIQRQLVHNRSVDGDAFLLLRDVSSVDRPIPLTLEVIAADRVETPASQAGNRRIRYGVERDSDGRIVAYWIRRSRPNDIDPDETHTRVPAFDSGGRRRVCHFKRHTWQDATRGLPDCYPVVNDLKDLDDLWEAQSIRQYIQACMAGFVKTFGDSEEIAMLAASGLLSDGRRIEDISPGQMHYLGPNQEIEFSSPQGEDNLDPYMSWRLRGISAGLKFPYELLVKKWENSYSGGRLSLIDGHQTFRGESSLLDSQGMRHVWRLFVLEALLVGELTIDETLFAEEEHRICKHEWIGEAMPWIDPQGEIEAEAMAVALGIDLLENSLKRRGIDPEEFYTRREHELERMKKAGMPQLLPNGWSERLTPEQQAEAAAGRTAEPGNRSGSQTSPKQSRQPAGAAS